MLNQEKTTGHCI